MTTSSSEEPAAASTVFRFSNACLVCASKSAPPTSCPAASSGTCPETKSKRPPPVATACV
ncbi:MAG TPA: hypothetical protein VFS43_11595 [Polyangiaceae bacterium]|nr:hypothetical protein [Polyangiaceae bacterium]